jgi:hypothetical protein
LELLFIEDRAQSWLAERQGLAQACSLVAVTAEALQAAEEFGLPVRPVGGFCATLDLLPQDRNFFLRTMDLAQEIEGFMAARRPELGFEGFGFLSANMHYLWQTAIGVLSRLYLMRAAMAALKPRRVLLFAGRVPPEFVQNGVSASLWAEGVAALAEECGAGFELLPEPTAEDYAQSAFDPMQGQASWPRPELDVAPSRPRELPNARGLRLLLVGLGGYDWTPVIDALLANGADCSELPLQLPGRFGRFTFQSVVRDLATGARRELEVPAADPFGGEEEALRVLFGQWLARRSAPPRLELFGIDVFPALRPLLETWAATLPGIVRHTDALARELFKGGIPDLMCFFAQPWVCARRLVFHARARGVHTVEYLHGGGYPEIINRITFEFLISDMDSFLTYGAGYVSRGELSKHVAHIPVGSARIEQLARWQCADKHNGPLRVLWVGGFSTGNSHGDYWYEDTRRYRLQKECLTRLARNPDLHVIYRSYPGQWAVDGTSRFVRTAGFSTVQADGNPGIEDSLCACDLVITDVYTGTIWPEALVLKKPMLLYFDPQCFPVPVEGRSAELLEQAVFWCRSEPELLAAVDRLAREGREFALEVASRDASGYLSEAILHGADGDCATRAAAFCASLRTGAGSAPPDRNLTEGP